MTERKLDDIAMSNGMWREAAQDMLANQWGLKEQSDHYALQIAGEVISGSLDVEDLKAEASALNDLDAQAHDVSGANVAELQGDDFKEAMARRVGHHATKTAFKHVRTENDRISFRHGLNNVDRMLRSQQSGMGRLEKHDVSLDLVLRAAGKRVK